MSATAAAPSILARSSSVVHLPPAARPARPLQLTAFDHHQLAWSSVTTATLLRSAELPADFVVRLHEALTRVAHANPALAGRLTDLAAAADADETGASPRQVAVTWPDDERCGCTFDVRALTPAQEAVLETVAADADAVVRHAVGLQDLFRDLGLREPGSGEDQLASGGPLACLSLFTGSCTSVAVFSVSHALGDGFAYYELLRALDQELLVPDSAVPLGPRHGVDAAVEQVLQQYTPAELAAQRAFFPGMYMENIARRDLTQCHELRVHVPLTALERLRAAAVRRADPGSVVSKQDALCAWVANHLGAAAVAYVVNIRGRAAGVPPRAMCNGEMIWYACASGGGLKGAGGIGRGGSSSSSDGAEQQSGVATDGGSAAEARVRPAPAAVAAGAGVAAPAAAAAATTTTTTTTTSCAAATAAAIAAVDAAVAGPLVATDVRESIGRLGARTGFTLELARACATTPATVVGMNSWLKVQYLPEFLGAAGLHVPVYTWESLPVVARTVSNLLYALTPTEHVLHHWGLDPDQLASLRAGWAALGVHTTTHLPGVLVADRVAAAAPTEPAAATGASGSDGGGTADPKPPEPAGVPN